MENVENIEKLIGRAVVSLETANTLGRVADLLADPLSGQLAGFSVQRVDQAPDLGRLALSEIHRSAPNE